jgi:AcrR family transcriptional regulator
MTHTVGVRAAQKWQTRQALLAAALRLMEHQSLGGLSLREISRAAGIVPAGFYRHFPDVESLGVALVEQSLGGLRTALRAVRIGRTDTDDIARRSVDVLAREVRAQPAQFRFVARERYGGLVSVRQAIARQLYLFSEELAADLLDGNPTAAAVLGRWAPADVRMLTTFIVNHMLCTAANLLMAADGPAPAEALVIEQARRQLRLIVIGGRHWLDDPVR